MSIDFRQPGVAGPSPCTLTTSLAVPVPSSSCSESNGHATAPLTTRDFCPRGFVVWASSKLVQPHW